MITEILIILLLIIINGVLSASEIAIVSAKKTKLQTAAEKNNRAAIKALELKENPNQFLSTIQIGITLIGILTGFFGGGSISNFLADVFKNSSFLAPYSTQVSVIIVVFFITYLSLVIGELVPKRIGMTIPEKYATFISIPMDVLSKIVRPFVWVLSASTDFIVNTFNIKPNDSAVTDEEIKALMDEGVEGGSFEHIEHDLVDGVLNLGNKRATNLMVHRSKITYLDLKNSFDENKAYILKSEHTEFPVCDGSFDNIKGIIHIKAIFAEYDNTRNPNLEALIQPIPFVNENNSAYHVLEILRKAQVSQAIVVDEYGSPQGLITMKDVMSGLVGGPEMEEERDKKHIRKREDGSYIVDGSFQLDDFLDYFEIELSEDDFEEINSATTVAGLVFKILDHVPLEGESVTYKNLRLEVLDMDARRIDKLSVVELGINSSETEPNNID